MIEYYPQIKALHMALVAISVLGFAIRFAWVVRASKRLDHKLSRVLPHLIDTLLLVAGVSLAVMSQQFPWTDAWLAMKLFLLVVYIFLGVFALKRAFPAGLRCLFFIGALIAVTQMVGVALHRSPWGWFS